MIAFGGVRMALSAQLMEAAPDCIRVSVGTEPKHVKGLQSILSPSVTPFQVGASCLPGYASDAGRKGFEQLRPPKRRCSAGYLSDNSSIAPPYLVQYGHD